MKLSISKALPCFSPDFVPFVATAQSGPKSLPRITSQADFDALSVTYDANTPYALPHVMIVIDRKDGNKIYYVNKKRYSFHKDFVNGTYLSLERGREFFENNYIKPNRRFILGTLAYQTPLKRWTFEFWEGDLIPPDQIQLTYDVVNKLSSLRLLSNQTLCARMKRQCQSQACSASSRATSQRNRHTRR